MRWRLLTVSLSLRLSLTLVRSICNEEHGDHTDISQRREAHPNCQNPRPELGLALKPDP